MSGPDWEMQQHLLDEQMRYEFEQIQRDPAYQAWLDAMESDDDERDTDSTETPVSGESA